MKLKTPPFAFWFIWHCLAVAAIVLIPTRLQFGVLWNLSADARVLITGAAAAYVTSITLLTLISRYRGEARVMDVVWSFGPIFAALFLYLAMRPPVDLYPRTTMLLSLMLAGILALVPFALGALLRKAAVPALVLVIVGCVLPSVTQSAERNNERKIIRTNAYNLIARFYRNRLQEDETGGGIERFRDRYLLATGDGSLYVFEWDSKTQDLELQKLPHQVPLNRADFVRDTASTPTPGRIFRSADILVDNEGDSFRLFAAHHYWHSDQRCVTVRLSVTSELTHRSSTLRILHHGRPCMNRRRACHSTGRSQVIRLAARCNGSMPERFF